MAVISERALVHMPQKRIENSNPQSAPRIPRFFGPRVEGLAISSDKRYIAALVRTPDAGADMRSPVSTIAVFRYPSLDHVKSVSAIVRVFPWQTERFLATYLSFGATHNWSTALDKTGRNWVEDRRGPSAEAKSLRSPSQVKWLKALLSKSNLQLTQVDLSYDSPYFAATKDFKSIAIHCSALLSIAGSPAEENDCFLLSASDNWKVVRTRTKFSDIRFIKLWNDMVIVGTSVSALEPDEAPYVEAFTMSGRSLFCLEGGAFLSIE